MKDPITASIIDKFYNFHVNFDISTSANIISTASTISKLNPKEKINFLDRIYINTNS